LAFSAAALIGCKERVPVLKVPENADECFDLFRFFTDPAFGLEQAKAGLGVTGEPRVLDDPKSRKLYTFEDQSGLLERIGLQIGPDGRPDAGKLNAMYLYYRNPIDVSLSRLESYLGPSDERNKKIAAQLAMFTNLQPGQKEREISSYSFYPDQPIAPGHLKGDLLFKCDTVSSDTKRVDSLRYQRRL
jgi:hypothetical protein